MTAKDMVDEAENNKYQVVTIPDSIRDRIRGMHDASGSPIRDLEQFKKELNESFEFKFIAPKDMSSTEKAVFGMTDAILNLVNGKPKEVKEIRISETMRRETHSFEEASGLWEQTTGRIIIKRDQLRSLEDYAGTLLHEIAHARSNALDISRDFEKELTSFLGLISSKVASS